MRIQRSIWREKRAMEKRQSINWQWQVQWHYSIVLSQRASRVWHSRRYRPVIVGISVWCHQTMLHLNSHRWSSPINRIHGALLSHWFQEHFCSDEGFGGGITVWQYSGMVWVLGPIAAHSNHMASRPSPEHHLAFVLGYNSAQAGIGQVWEKFVMQSECVCELSRFETKVLR